MYLCILTCSTSAAYLPNRIYEINYYDYELIFTSEVVSNTQTSQVSEQKIHNVEILYLVQSYICVPKKK
jgi:hypothetical protein